MNKTPQIHASPKTNSYLSALVASSGCFQLPAKILPGQLIYYKLLKLSKICDKTGNLECSAFLELWKF